MDDRTTFGKRLSDAFLPKLITDFLYTKYVKVFDTYINGWSFMHLLSGIIVSMKYDWHAALLIHTLWELFQAIIGDNDPTLETLVDVPLDTLFFMFGWWIGKKLREKKNVL
jgi:hypothetical protein|uniref:VanZ-like domain-containing protein n=1 Tax=viral metagenome TaxID=1070528 RepID=A0A6C0IUK2_9ZZZZ